MKTLLAVFIPILVFAYFLYKPNSQPVLLDLSSLPTKSPITKDGLFTKLNKWRTNHGLGVLEESLFLCGVAETRLPEVKRDWSHDGFTGREFCDNCILGENLAKDMWSEEDVIEAWEKSTTHLEQLSTNYTHGCVETDGNIVVLNLGYW
jgi:uncharacterized protein YkwD